jgi:hypothetical protein
MTKTEKTAKSADAPKRSRPKLDDLIVWLCTERGEGRSISPMLVAKTFADGRKGDEAKPSHWARDVRSAAIGLARTGKISVFRKGKAVDPDDLKALKGVYRIGLPRPERAEGADDESED